MSDVFAVVAGGGTAGHLLPGIAVAAALDRPVHFVVSERPIDETLISATPYSFTKLPGRGIQRKFTAANLVAAGGLVKAQFEAFRLLRRLRPQVVLAVGGYASVACAVAAVILRIPLVIAEQNAKAGLANRLVARWACACAVPFESTDLPHAVVTGNPVRSEVLATVPEKAAEARSALGIAEAKTSILVFSGSLGSKRINEAVSGIAEKWRDRSDIVIRHVVGHRDWPEISVMADGFEGAIGYRVYEFEDDMATALSAADLAVCRAGGTTVAELAEVGLPAVLVPLPIATRDHQSANGRELVRHGAAVMIPDDEVEVSRLCGEIAGIIDVEGKLDQMRDAAQGLGHPDAAQAVAELLISHARPSKAQ